MHLSLNNIISLHHSLPHGICDLYSHLSEDLDQSLQPLCAHTLRILSESTCSAECGPDVCNNVILEKSSGTSLTSFVKWVAKGNFHFRCEVPSIHQVFWPNVLVCLISWYSWFSCWSDQEEYPRQDSTVLCVQVHSQFLVKFDFNEEFEFFFPSSGWPVITPSAELFVLVEQARDSFPEEAEKWLKQHIAFSIRCKLLFDMARVLCR